MATTSSLRFGHRAVFAFAVSLAVASCTEKPRSSHPTDEGPRLGGRLVSTLRSEPLTFNPLFVTDSTSGLIIDQTHADLVRENPITFEIEPALAESWQIADDGRLYALELRRRVKFSDGEPFDADDVLFTFEVLLDPAIGSPQREMLSPDGQPVEVHKIDSHTVHFRLQQALAVGLLMFEGLAILPEHLLRPIYERGELAEAWNIGTSPEELVGLGPFRLAEYQPANRIVLERNPHSWRTDAEGLRLPYLDELSLEITGSADAELLRFEAGASQIVGDLTAENFDLLKRDATKSGLQLVDAGAGLAREILVWNLNDLSSKDLPETERHQSWIRQRPFRQAISKAIDRDAIVTLVYQGKAAPLATIVSSGNEKWLNRDLPQPELDVDAGRALLKSAGFRRQDDRLLDRSGRPVELTFLTSSTNERKGKVGAIIAQDLRDLGIA